MDPLAELAALDDRYQQATQARRAIDAQERTAHEAVQEASAALEELHRQRLSGDEPPGKAIGDAEKRLDRARAATQQEWAIQRQAGDRVVRAADAARHAYIEAHADALLAALAAEAAPLAQEMTALAQRAVELQAQLAAAEARTMRIVHAAHPGDERRVTAPCSGPLVEAAHQLLAAGGERAPTYTPPPVPVPEEVAS